MLLGLCIRNFALIDSLDVKLYQGLNILTGETGAGKSIIIDSINAMLGQRTSRDVIRTGKDEAFIEGVFHSESPLVDEKLRQIGINSEEDGIIVISREISISGRNICRINGRHTTVSNLKIIGDLLIDIHGQYDSQSLLRTESHIMLLDAFGGMDIRLLKNDYFKYLEQYKKLNEELKNLSGDKHERERAIDFLRYQINEIESTGLSEKEEEELRSRKLVLGNAEKISEALSAAYDLITGESERSYSVMDGLNKALSEISALIEFGKEYEELKKALEDSLYSLQDASAVIRKQREGTDFEPGLLDSVEERLSVIDRLKKKYGDTVKDVLESLNEMTENLDKILNSEKAAEKIELEIGNVHNKMNSIAKDLYIKRMEAAKILEENIGTELYDLQMDGAVFKVEIQHGLENTGSTKYYEHGVDKVEFLISPNRGEPLKPLSKIASGGEMSRIMLAIKKILADVDSIETLIFDEIDIGISGKASSRVSEKLKYISRKHQVICVTHLAQIAIMADNHFKIEKNIIDNRTVACIKRLGQDDRIHEVARMIAGGDETDISLKHAEQMIKQAEKQYMAP